MTTQSWSSRVRHDSDAVFREWGSELSTKLAAAGLTQTADTGQINWVTVVRAGTNANAGYEIWRMADTQQATAPVFLRIDYGTGSGTTSPRIQITLGTGSNGSGTITGTALTTARSIHAPTAQTTDTVRNSYVCVNQGFIGIYWKVGSGTDALFVFNRTCDTTGTSTATGGMVIWGSTSASALTATQALRFASTAIAYTARTAIADTALGMNPQSVTSTLVGSDQQVFMGWTITPAVAPLFGVCGCLEAEFPQGTSFTATLVGTSARTYIALATTAGPFSANGATGAYPKFAMLWD
jgi:hypothetical protein